MVLKSSKTSQVICTSALLSLLQITSNGAIAGDFVNHNTKPAKPSLGMPNSNGNTNLGASISDVYSDIDMRVRLASKSSLASCAADQCAENLAFDARVSGIGRYLSKAAIQLYPQQEQVIQRMQFSVVEKQEAGTASNNKGQIVVLRGVQDLQLSDDALGFVIAREMAHVMAGHHKTNTSTKLIISALASIIFPAIAIVGASSAAAQASTSLLTSAASTATSMLGGEVAMAQLKPTQLNQADEIALTIMEKIEWDIRTAESVLVKDEPPQSAWLRDLEASRVQLANKIEIEDAQITPLEDDFLSDDNSEQLADEKSDLEHGEELDIEPKQALGAEQNIEEIILESKNIEHAEQDGVKINALEANIDEPYEALPEKSP